MVRTTGLLLLLRGLLRFTTSSHPEAVGACYVALWRLPRPDFHRIVIRTLQGAPTRCYTPCSPLRVTSYNSSPESGGRL